jgi:3-oxoacyl-[acyl-carrier protein] reductase
MKPVMVTTGLKGQRVLVTAASQGIGYGAAQAFLGEGARVVINSSNADNLAKAQQSLSQFGEVHSVAGDLTISEDIDNLVAKTVGQLGGLDTLIYVTGSPKPGTMMEQDYSTWESAARLLTISPSYLTKKVAEIMIAQNVKGRMVLSASDAIREPEPNLALSNVCRISILGIVRTLARELGPHGIRVNAVLPGTIRTGRIDQLVEDISKRNNVSEAMVMSRMVSQIPLGYIGSVEEMARAFVYLGSDLSSYVSGAVLPVDGAMLRSID